MRIAFIVSTFPTLSETFILNQITGLIDRGHEVDIFAKRRGDVNAMHPDVQIYRLMDRTRFAVPLAKNRLKRPFTALRLIGTHFRKNPLAILRSINIFKYGKRAASCRLLHEVIPYAGQPDYDIIQCHFGPIGIHAATLKKLGLLKGKIVVMFHGADIRMGNQEGPGVYSEIMSRDIFVLSISTYNKANLLKFGFDPHNIIDHPVGVDIKKFLFRWRNEQPSCSHDGIPAKILTVARLVREKGLQYGIMAIKEALARNPLHQIHYKIIGDGDQRSNLEELAARMNLRNVVTFTGGKDQTYVRRELQQADIFLLPSINEALPVCLMEAQASGLPVVASAVGSVDEIVKDGLAGFLVQPGDIRAMADKLTYLIDNPQMWPEMGRAGRAHVEANYDIDKLNDRLVEIYESLLNG